MGSSPAPSPPRSISPEPYTYSEPKPHPNPNPTRSRPQTRTPTTQVLLSPGEVPKYPNVAELHTWGTHGALYGAPCVPHVRRAGEAGKAGAKCLRHDMDIIIHAECVVKGKNSLPLCEAHLESCPVSWVMSVFI